MASGLQQPPDPKQHRKTHPQPYPSSELRNPPPPGLQPNSPTSGLRTFPSPEGEGSLPPPGQQYNPSPPSPTLRVERSIQDERKSQDGRKIPNSLVLQRRRSSVGQAPGQQYKPPSSPTLGVERNVQDWRKKSQGLRGSVFCIPLPPFIPNLPAGLESLAQVDRLHVHQKTELLEVFTGVETWNKYSVKNDFGQIIYYVMEDTDSITTNACGTLRPFEIVMLDDKRKEAIRLSRPFRCTSCFCPCFLQELEVCAHDAKVIGYVRQEWTLCCPAFRVENDASELILCIHGPFFTSGFTKDVEFQVVSSDRKNQVGKITKRSRRTLLTNADTFCITFPMDLDVTTKAVLLGACFLIVFVLDL